MFRFAQYSLAAVVALLFSTALFASPGDSVSGAIAYDGKPLPVIDIHARQVDNPSNAPPQKSRLKIMLADREMPVAARSSETVFVELAKSGALLGILLETEIPSGRMTNFSLSHPQGSGVRRSGFIGDDIQLSDFRIADGWVSGRLHTPAPVAFDDFLLPDVANPAKTYAFDLRFRARIEAPRKMLQILTGPAAQKSPQADAIVAQRTLLVTGDVARIRAGLHPDDAFYERFADQKSGREFLAQMKQFGMLTPPAALRASIRRVVVFDDYSTITIATGPDTTSMSVSQKDGAWRVIPVRSPDD
jgi:hypothetical protein